MGKKIDLTGQRFGKLVVVREVAERDKHKRVLWNCLCDCGKQIQVAGGALKSGNTKSCGCITTAINLVGQRFGKLVAIKDVGRKNGIVLWECLCDCGKHTNVVSNNLTRGNTKSCGCSKRKDLTGQRFDRLVVIKDVGRKNGMVLWECECDCGKITNTTSDSLRGGKTRSCGCARGSLDLIGERFGRLTVLNKTNERYFGGVVWKCQCDCGKYTNTSSNHLMVGHVKSCGCLASENLEGERYGKLLVIRRTDERSNHQVVWECLCDCGNYKNVNTGSLGSGNTKSCGCLQFPSGTDSYNYKPHLTDEDRLRRRYYLGGVSQRIWSKQIMERDNYTCQICSQHGGKLNAHHLNGWNAFPEQRFDLDNGATLCEDCHKEFHSQYGYGDNTREQFNEYAASKTLVLN